ncbi:hypothetical protein [Azospirillum endophyticum]
MLLLQGKRHACAPEVVHRQPPAREDFFSTRGRAIPHHTQKAFFPDLFFGAAIGAAVHPDAEPMAVGPVDPPLG